MACTPKAFSLATAPHIELVPLSRTTACVHPFAGDATLFCLVASLVIHPEKEETVNELSLRLDMPDQISSLFWL
jgi:hypothetical protein